MGFININSIPEDSNDPKNDNIMETVNLCEFDNIGFAEVNRGWNKIKVKNRWSQRIKPWWEHSKTVVGFNTKDCIQEAFQPGD